MSYDINDAENTNASGARQSADMHKYADTDSSRDALHHTLGGGPNQAAPGDHNHDGANSSFLFNGVTISGSRTNGAALQQLLDALTKLGLTNNSSA